MNDRDEYIESVTVGEPVPHDGRIVLAEYDPRWPARFRRAAAAIRCALGSKAHRVHHVGSTAVPGLAAKPVIDIVLVVADPSDEPSYVPGPATVGLRLAVREPGWYEHRLLTDTDRCVNVHVFADDTPEVGRMLTFRDRLRDHPDDRHRYEQVKRRLAQHTWRHVQHYADAKTAIIDDIMNRADESGPAAQALGQQGQGDGASGGGAQDVGA